MRAISLGISNWWRATYRSAEALPLKEISIVIWRESLSFSGNLAAGHRYIAVVINDGQTNSFAIWRFTNMRESLF